MTAVASDAAALYEDGDYGYENAPEWPAYERELPAWAGDDEGWEPA